MTPDRSCANCGVALQPDAPEGSICIDCAQAAANAASEDFTPTVAADGATPAPSTGSASIRANPQPLFERIGDFEVLDKLGQGGMGAVYRARQVSLDRLVALKILPSQFEEEESYIGRFRREATVAASLNHPNLVRVYSSGEADGVHFIAMELVEGENLRQFLRRAGPMAPLDALRICLGVARGLQCGWNKAQLIHRDIKPSNIYLSQSGEVKLGDLGLAKSLSGNTTGITHTGTALGTPHYVSPEQARGDKTIDCRADIYSLGCTLYELLTGATPYKGSDPMTIMNMHVNSPPPAILKVLPQCPVPVARLVGKMLRKKPHERHQSYDELVAAMEAAIDQLENPNTGPSAVVQAWKEIGKAEQGFLPVRGAAAKASAATSAPAARDTSIPAGPQNARKPVLIWAGIAAVAAILAIAFILMKNGKSEPAPGRAGTLAAATPPAANASTKTRPEEVPVGVFPAGRWIQGWPLMRNLAAGALLPLDAYREQAGWIEVPPKRSLPVLASRVAGHDTAVRATFRYNGDSGVFGQVVVRSTAGPGKSYRVRLSFDSTNVRLVWHDDTVPKGTTNEGILAQMPIPKPLAPGDSYTLQIAAVGQRITAWYDGVKIGEASDSRFSEGLTGLQTGEPFRDFEVINLDGVPEAEALKLAGQASGTAPVALWVDATAQVLKEGLRQGRLQADGNWAQGIGTGSAYLAFGPQELADGTIRVTFSHRINLSLRKKGDRNDYSAKFDGASAELLRRDATVPRGIERLNIKALANDLYQDDAEHVAVFVIKGSALRASLDGTAVIGASDSHFAGGRLELTVYAGDKAPPTRIKKVEWADLSGLPEAEALKLAGVSSSAKATAVPAADPWQDLLHNSASLKLTGAAERKPDGSIRLSGTGDVSNGFAPKRDVAVRMRANFSNRTLNMRLRQNEKGCYEVNVRPGGKSIVVGRFEGPPPKVTPLKEFNLREPLQNGRMYELEVRIAGQTFTVKLNGEALGTANDDAFPVGHFSVAANDREGDDVTLTSFGLLDLDERASSTAPPANLSTPAAGAENWQNVLHAPNGPSFSKDVATITPAGLQFLKSGVPRVSGAPPRDGALRIRTTFDPANTKLGLRARITAGGKAFYQLQVSQPDRAVLSRYDVEKNFAAELAGYDLARPLTKGEEYELELRIVGALLTTRLNNTTLGELRDATLPEGEWGVFHGDDAAPLVTKIEVLRIDSVAATLGFAAATKEQPFVNSLGMKFVPVPIIGGPTGGQRVLFSIWETRVQDYAAFVDETKRAWEQTNPAYKGATQPATHVSWHDAVAFAAWLTERERKAGRLAPGESYRLPNDHEWSCAVGIGTREDANVSAGLKNGRIPDAFPWGATWPPPENTGNFAGDESDLPPVPPEEVVLQGYRDPFRHTAPVGSFAPNALGLYDLSGNAWEWCGDPLPGETRVVSRGGSHLDFSRKSLLSCNRSVSPPEVVAGNRGFRVVLAPASTAAINVETSPATVTKDAPFVNSLGMKFVPVPITGGPTGGQRVLFSIWETRRQDYRAFVTETNREWSEPKPLFQQGATHPAVMVGWEDATAFCVWLTKREREAKKIGARESYRLPTDHEWSCAAGIGEQEDPAQAPEAKSAKTNEPSAMVGAWPPPAPTGNYGGEEIQPVLTAGVATGEFPATAKPLSEYRDQFVNTAPVGSFPASRLGLHDLDGNVREYCADAPDPGKEQRILRGGSWLSNFRAALLPARRNFTTRRSPTGIDGFRVVLAEE